MCVVRFDIPLDSVQQALTTTVMSTLTFSVSIMYNNQVTVATATQQQLSAMNTMTDFIYYLNEIINTAYDTLLIALSPTLLQKGYTPYFSWDPEGYVMINSSTFTWNQVYIDQEFPAPSSSVKLQ